LILEPCLEGVMLTSHLTQVLTTYADDDRAVWKEFRRELVTDGFSSSTIRKYKGLIKAYIKELAERGLLDEDDPYEQGDPHDRLNQGAVAMSENGQSPSIVSSPDESTADAVSENGRQAVANQEKPDPEREGHKRNAREAEIARMQAERDAEFVQRDANEDPGGSLHKENRHVQSAEPIRGRQEQEELDREKGRQRHEQEDPERLQAAEHLEKLSLADNASSETTTSVQMIETDSESSTCEFENGLGYDTAWTRLRPDDDAGNSEPPPWLQDRGNYDLDYDGPSHPAYVLVAAPYGICVAAPYCKDGRAYTNVSLIWWHFWLRTETIDKSLSAPDVSRVLSTDAEIEPLIRRNIERLYALGDASTNILAHIVSREVVVVSDDYSLVSCHRSFLEYVMKGAWGEEAFMKIIHRIIDWILEYELVEGLTTFTSVRQWLDLTRLDTEATYECLPRTPSGIYSSFEPWDPIESDSRPELRATVANAASIAWHCKEVETHVHETRTTWSHFQASLASAPDSLQLKTWRRYYYIKIAPVCREFLSGLLATDSKVYEDTLGMLQEWVEEHYVTDLVHFDLQGRPDLEKVRREGLREVHGLIQAMMERKHTLKTFAQLASIECLLYSELKPKCVLFVSNPPKKANIRDVEYKKLSETLLSRVILELDAVKTMGDRELIAAKRKQLIWETQAMLSELDAVRKR